MRRISHKRDYADKPKNTEVMSHSTKEKPIRLAFDPRRYTTRAKNMILARASQWSCTPEEAVERILDEKAKEQHKPQPAA